MARLFFMLLSLFTVPAAFASQYQYAGRFHDKEWYIRPYSGETPLGVLSFYFTEDPSAKGRSDVLFLNCANATVSVFHEPYVKIKKDANLVYHLFSKYCKQ
jgi:hypothetical protein